MQQSLAEPIVVVSHDSPVKLVVASPDGKLIATADTERHVRVWRDGQMLFEKYLRTWHDRFLALDRVRAMVFAADSSKLYVASGETIKTFDTQTGEQVWEHGRLPTFAFLITCPQWMTISDKGYLAAAYDDGAVEVHRPEGRIVWSDNDSPKTMSFLPGGEHIAGTDYVSVCIWDSFTGAKVKKFRAGHKIYALAVSPVTGAIATRSLHEVEIWDSMTGQRFTSIPSKIGLPTLCMHPTKPLLAIGDARGFCVADFGGETVLRVETAAFAPLSFAFTPSGDALYIGCSDNQVRRWDVSYL